MKRVFGLIIVISAFASAGASMSSSIYAQSGRARRAEPPKEEHAQKPESRDEAKDEAKDKAGDDGATAQKADDGEKVWTGKEVDVRAVIKSRPLPLYPRGMRLYEVAWQVKLRIILGADGEVRDEIEVLEGSRPGFTEEAIKAARRIEFEPAQKDGRPVSQYVTLIYHFNLH